MQTPLGKHGMIARCKVAILSFSDGRERVHASLKEYIQGCAERIEKALTDSGRVEVTLMPDIISGNGDAKRIAHQIAALDIDACIYNVCVFSFPNFSAIAQRLINLPSVAIAPDNGAYPGLGGLQAAVNFIRQTGGQCEKVWGDIETPEILQHVLPILSAAMASRRLCGQVFGLIGGRSIGMGSGAANADAWMHRFGVDTVHMDQLEIIRRAERIADAETERAIRWLGEKTRAICYDGDKLTAASLRMQIKCYMALKSMIAEHSLDFVAVKCHYELSEYYVAQCLSAALCNDPYDWDGPKEPVVYSCEADADGALTMQILHLMTGEPVLFLDFRHYLKDVGVFAFCNCGACATWFARRSDSPLENMKNVTLFPLIPKYAGDGCHIGFMAAPGTITFARLTRVLDRYKMQAFLGELETMPEETMKLTCAAWPHGYARVASDPYALVQKFESNHIHGAVGDHMQALRLFCQIQGIEFEPL